MRLENLLKIVFTLLICSFGTILLAQNQKAKQLRNNVVAITTTFEDGYQEHGFGFILKEVDERCIIATAGHVVSGGMGRPRITLRFFGRESEYTAKVVLLENENELDLALLSSSKPAGYRWETSYVGANPKRDDQVTYIGRDGTWYMPTPAAEGQVNQVSNVGILVDIQSVTRGTSGAPLIASSGIVGLITDSDVGIARAIPISRIKTIVGAIFPDQGGSSSSATSFPSVRINGKTWMTQNLNYEVPGSWCYDDDPANCRTYGRLYTWEAAKKACAAVGWRLPTDAEWKALAKTYGGYFDWETEEDIGDPKKAYSALWENGSSGFSAQLGGYRYSNGDFDLLGSWGFYWSATERDAYRAWSYDFGSYRGELSRYHYRKSDGRSCRCLQD